MQFNYDQIPASSSSRTRPTSALLISPDFIASDYCFDREMTRALERHELGDARVVPIILRPTDWRTADFARLQALPKDARPITSWPDQDQAFLDVVQGLRKVIGNLRPAAPDYPDAETRERSLALEQAYERRAELEASSGPLSLRGRGPG